MNSEDHMAKKKKNWLSLRTAQEVREEDNAQAVATRHEVRHLRRVPKHGDKWREHMSEDLEQHKVTEADLQITKEVIESATRPHFPEPATIKASRASSFSCLRCGASILIDCVRCPECGVLYVQDPKSEAIDEGAECGEERPIEGGNAELLERREIAFAHFDASSGTVTSLKTEGDDPDFGLECHYCGAITQFGTDVCPLCGHDFDEWDTGLVGLLEGLKFDLDEDTELNCPVCGEHVVIQDGRCPSCKETLQRLGPRSQGAGVLSVLNEKDVVFVHFDVGNGELWFARKLKFRKPGNSDSVHLDSISKVGFDEDWKSLSRI